MPSTANFSLIGVSPMNALTSPRHQTKGHWPWLFRVSTRQWSLAFPLQRCWSGPCRLRPAWASYWFCPCPSLWVLPSLWCWRWTLLQCLFPSGCVGGSSSLGMGATFAARSAIGASLRAMAVAPGALMAASTITIPTLTDGNRWPDYSEEKTAPYGCFVLDVLHA